MSNFTHVFHEQGNGFPQVGDEVLVADDSGWHSIHLVETVSRIQTGSCGSGQANYIYLTLEDAERDYDNLSESAQDRAWNNLHHVSEIAEIAEPQSYASIYTQDGAELTTGLQVSAVSDEAIQAAERWADRRGEDVELHDDDGVWLVHPNRPDGSRELADKVRD